MKSSEHVQCAMSRKELTEKGSSEIESYADQENLVRLQTFHRRKSNGSNELSVAEVSDSLSENSLSTMPDYE